jgi:hypothetical protein
MLSSAFQDYLTGLWRYCEQFSCSKSLPGMSPSVNVKRDSPIFKGEEAAVVATQGRRPRAQVTQGRVHRPFTFQAFLLAVLVFAMAAISLIRGRKRWTVAIPTSLDSVTKTWLGHVRASSEHAPDHAVHHAFGGHGMGRWASAATDKEPWIRIQLPTPPVCNFARMKVVQKAQPTGHGDEGLIEGSVGPSVSMRTRMA